MNIVSLSSPAFIADLSEWIQCSPLLSLFADNIPRRTMMLGNSAAVITANPSTKLFRWMLQPQIPVIPCPPFLTELSPPPFLDKITPFGHWLCQRLQQSSTNEQPSPWEYPQIMEHLSCECFVHTRACLHQQVRTTGRQAW